MPGLQLRNIFAATVLLASVVSGWVHPGILHSSADLERMNGYISAGLAGTESPQYTTYLNLAANSYSSDVYTMSTPVATLTSRGSFEADAAAAYQNALMWVFTGIAKHADKSIEIMDAWSSTLKAVDSTYLDKQLASSLGPFLMTNAAELIRYTNGGWSSSGISAFSDMLTDVFYPVLDDFSGVQYEANVGTGNTKAIIAFGVFTENTDMYDTGISNYQDAPCAGLSVDISSTGQASESGRDQGHTQLGLGNLAESCQIAANQYSTDLWSLLSNRLLAGFEYTAQYNLGNSVSYDASFQRCDANLLGGPFTVISPDGQGEFRPVYELPYAHYVSVEGLSAPYTTEVVNKVGTEGGSPVNSPADSAGWGTLLYRIE